MTAGLTELVEPEVLQSLLDVLSHSPAGLFTDIDGTVSKIAAVPSEAHVSEQARAALNRLSGNLAIVGAVTGRAAGDGAAMLGLPDLIVVGNHGLEWQHRDERWVHPDADASRRSLQAALAEVGAATVAAGLDEGVILEDKRLSASIHYRLTPDPVVARELILEAAQTAAQLHRLRITEGRFVVELRPEVIVNKGTAIVELVKAHHLEGVVFLGDDVTDVDAFVAIRTLRENGTAATAAVGVLSAETHPSVELMADVTVQGVDACIALLASLGASLGQMPRESSPTKASRAGQK
jgi:trehalose 6-phosphate phosphatase